MPKRWKQLTCPTMDEQNVVYLHNGILFHHKKELNFAIFNNMDGSGEY